MTISNEQMHIAAQRRLRIHLQTRPATSEEAQEFAMGHRDEAAKLRAKADQHWPMPCGYDRPANHGQRASDAVKAKLAMKAEAAREDLHADAWDRVGPETWEQTRRELQARVDYYATAD